MTEQADKRTYKKTLNLPKTSFAMKANLVQREPEFQKRWAKIDLYRKMRQQDHPAGPFVFHDGPPYANGDIHIGHLLNKVLKDFVVRTRTMAGHDVEFIPGWDCHGLPIEHKVMKDLGDAARGMEPLKIRYKCKAYAEKYVKLQKGQMLRLGTVANYDEPYITMDPAYEAGVMDVFADLVDRGLVYRALKPVHWSIANRTALADAELEYEDREDTSVYVLFEITNTSDLPAELDAPASKRIDFVIWTTTPWTLPANMAVAVSHSNFLYCLYEYVNGSGETRYLIANDNLAEGIGGCSSFFEAAGISEYRKLGTCAGSQLEEARIRYQHPFIARTSPVVCADYVTAEDGTGLVHTAPGHGVEDFQTGRFRRLHFKNRQIGSDVECILPSEHEPVGLNEYDVYCPVLEDGTFDDTAPDWLRGESVWDGNDRVVDHLRDSGHLFHANKFVHSYPHDWRGKTPVIFRATSQWFIGVDEAFSDGPQGRASLRRRALDITADTIDFVPAWGRNRMRGMLESRPDWCISRQRSWGLPIPAFVHKQTGEPLLTAESVRHVADLVRKQGGDVWFKSSAAELLAGCPGVDAPDAYEKGGDTFDVWFESGSSWHAVMRQRELARPDGAHTDLYLEGSDQHRGWFQTSLLLGLGATGRSPFATVLTHGFMVDKHGKKMSKSGGNAINVEDLLKEYGTDVCRWWVAGLAYDNDIKVDWDFFKLAGEEYRKVRNTIRFLLSNLPDPRNSDPQNGRREMTSDDLHSVDAWAMAELGKLITNVSQAYDRYEYRRASEAIYNFCNDAMSSVYLAAVKDRLYCDAPDSDRRRRTQTVIYDIAERLIRLVAPILVHTADEAYLALHGLDHKSERSVHTEPLPQPFEPVVAEGWPEAMGLRDRVLKAVEDARHNRNLDNPLDVGVTVMLAPEQYAPLKPLEAELADLCGVSRFELTENGNETIDIADLTDAPRCERSWKRDGTVKQRSDGGYLSDRDAAALGLG